MPEIRKNKSQDSSEHQQSVNLVKKFTNMDIKVKDNIFSAQSGSDVENTLVLSEASKLSTDNKAKVFARILRSLDTGINKRRVTQNSK